MNVLRVGQTVSIKEDGWLAVDNDTLRGIHRHVRSAPFQARIVAVSPDFIIETVTGTRLVVLDGLPAARHLEVV